ncbi:hypothetical protein BCR44DRAFT_1038732 [Catenaria anguillulae PL171]|uniref:Uncharacterized protein n=1 Tax=Catenaria anguillulae PL171 TaxID=765915 RepID=A0A1Y2H5I3_9FUNG|nr:hypothetical protein BCR44DRAFT_1038732 [Catenaria anguillulae PL171]
MMHSAPSLPPRPHLQQRQHQGRHDTGGSLVIGTRFQIMSADSSRVLNESSCPPNLTELLAAIPGAHQVDWAQGYTIAPHPTNEWLPSSIPRDLAFARLSLVLAPVTHLANHGGTRVLVGGVTAVHGYPDRTWSWGSLGQGGHCHPLPAAQFYTRVRPMHPADPACLLDYESGEPTQVFPRSTVSLDFHWAPHDPASPSSALVVAGLSHFASPIWRSPDAPSSNLRQLMLLPDIETWQDTDGCHGLSDFSLCTTDTRATCQWTDSMTALIRTSLHLPPVPTTLQLRHASNTAHDWQQWTRATHSFGSNLAQFHPIMLI